MPVAFLEYSIMVDCPNCGDTFDLVDTDHDHDISAAIFTNRWDDLRDYEVECTTCKYEFKIERVEY